MLWLKLTPPPLLMRAFYGDLKELLRLIVHPIAAAKASRTKGPGRTDPPS